MFLATKVEESPRHLKNIIQEVYITRYRQHPSVRKKLLNEPRVYEMIKDRVLVVERSLLYTVGFDFNVDTPYKFLVDLRNLLDDYLKHAFPSGVPESMYQPAPLDGEARGKNPYRVSIRSPMFITIPYASKCMVGYKVADIPAIMGSFDPCIGETDR